MLAGLSQDWPLSREEKKQRLLCLYDQDLKETSNLLQLSARRHSFPAAGRDADFHAAKENLCANEQSCNAPSSLEQQASPLRGHDGGSRSILGLWNDGDSVQVTPAETCVNTGCGVDSHLSDAPVAAQCKAAAPSEDAPCTQRSITTDVAPCTHRSVRSSVTEWFTPNASPRTPTGYCSTLGPVLRGSPALALRASTSRLPSARFRGTGKAELPPRLEPTAVPGTMEKSRSSSSSGKLRSRRHGHAAAASAFAAYTSSRDVPQKCSEASLQDECYPPQVLSAARHGRSAPVEAALIGGLPPNYTDSYGNTLFHIACQNGNKRVAKLVVKYGCNMNAQNSKGNTGLHFLFAYGYPDVAEYFIKKGADEHVRNAMGNVAREGIK